MNVAHVNRRPGKTVVTVVSIYAWYYEATSAYRERYDNGLINMDASFVCVLGARDFTKLFDMPLSATRLWIR